MLLVEKSSSEKDNFFNNFEKSMNNVYLSVSLSEPIISIKSEYYPKLLTKEYKKKSYYTKKSMINYYEPLYAKERIIQHNKLLEMHNKMQTKKITNYKE